MGAEEEMELEARLVVVVVAAMRTGVDEAVEMRVVAGVWLGEAGVGVAVAGVEAETVSTSADDPLDSSGTWITEREREREEDKKSIQPLKRYFCKADSLMHALF